MNIKTFTKLKRHKFIFMLSAFGISMFSALVLTNTSAFAATLTWDGSAGDNKFSTGANWSGDSAPTNGDVVVFPGADGVSEVTINNDLPSLKLGGLTQGQDGSGGGVVIYTNYVINKLNFANNAIIKRIPWGAYISISDSVSADGAVIFDGWGSPFGAEGKDITADINGLTVLNNPSRCFGGSGDEYAFSWKNTGDLTIGNNSYYNITGSEKNITVNNGGVLYLPYSEDTVTVSSNITFLGGGATQGNACGDAISLNANAKNTVLSGKITLSGGDILYDISNGSTLKITGQIDGSGSKLAAAEGSTGTFINEASSDNSQTAKGTIEVPVTTLPPITDSKPDEYLSVKSKTIVTLDGERGSVSVSADAVLKGVGLMKLLSVYKNGTVSPGHSPGRLTIKEKLHLYDDSIYDVEIKDKDNFDQLIVGKNFEEEDWDKNAVVLGSDDGLPVLRVSLLEGSSFAAGDSFMIIDNQSTTDIKGTFKDLPEGATFAVGDGGVYKITYKGGDGNDVVLSVVTAPKVPNTGFNMLKNNPVLTLLITTASAVAILVIAKKRTQTAR